MARHRNPDRSFPPSLHSRVRRLSPQAVRYTHSQTPAVPLGPHGHITDCVTTERSRIPLASKHPHKHLALPSCVPRTHSPAAARITTRVHRSPSIPARVLVWGTQPVLSSFSSYYELTRRLTTYVTLRNIWCKVWAHAVASEWIAFDHVMHVPASSALYTSRLQTRLHPYTLP